MQQRVEDDQRGADRDHRTSTSLSVSTNSVRSSSRPTRRSSRCVHARGRCRRAAPASTIVNSFERDAEHQPAARRQLARHQVHREVALLLGRERRAEHRDRERAPAHDVKSTTARSGGARRARTAPQRRDEHDRGEQREQDRLLDVADVRGRSCGRGPTPGRRRGTRRADRRSSDRLARRRVGGIAVPRRRPERGSRTCCVGHLIGRSSVLGGPRRGLERAGADGDFLCFARYSSRYLSTMSSSSFE